MNKLSVILSAALVLAVSSASAQSQFEGYYGQVGVGYSSVTSSVSNSNLTTAQSGQLSTVWALLQAQRAGLTVRLQAAIRGS